MLFLVRGRRDGELRQRDYIISGMAASWGVLFIVLAVTLTKQPEGERHTAVGLGTLLLIFAVGRLVLIKAMGQSRESQHVPQHGSGEVTPLAPADRGVHPPPYTPLQPSKR